MQTGNAGGDLVQVCQVAERLAEVLLVGPQVGGVQDVLRHACALCGNLQPTHIRNPSASDQRPGASSSISPSHSLIKGSSSTLNP